MLARIRQASFTCTLVYIATAEIIVQYICAFENGAQNIYASKSGLVISIKTSKLLFLDIHTSLLIYFTN